jgi:hypothetical protein
MEYYSGQSWAGLSDETVSSYLPGNKKHHRQPRSPGFRLRRRKLTLVHPDPKDFSKGSQRQGLTSSRLKGQFRQLAREWQADTMFDSSPVSMAIHPAYQRIIALGPDALPLVINELDKRGGHWFWALRFLADTDPVPEESWGNYEAMKKAWLDWWANR